jgi:hypothetical protein
MSALPPILTVKADIPDRQLRATTGRARGLEARLLGHLASLSTPKFNSALSIVSSPNRIRGPRQIQEFSPLSHTSSPDCPEMTCGSSCQLQAGYIRCSMSASHYPAVSV